MLISVMSSLQADITLSQTAKTAKTVVELDAAISEAEELRAEGKQADAAEMEAEAKQLRKQRVKGKAKARMLVSGANDSRESAIRDTNEEIETVPKSKYTTKVNRMRGEYNSSCLPDLCD
jgi:hypothetical protein